MHATTQPCAGEAYVMEVATLRKLNTHLPPPWPGGITPCLHKACEVLRPKVVVLDDDSTSTQAVHDVTILAGIGTNVSDGLAQVSKRLRTCIRFLSAKGSITSSDLAVHALNLRCALVLGQLLPGVPVWRLDQNSRFPGMPYVVSPDNVRETDALLHAYLACATTHVQA